MFIKHYDLIPLIYLRLLENEFERAEIQIDRLGEKLSNHEKLNLQERKVLSADIHFLFSCLGKISNILCKYLPRFDVADFSELVKKNSMLLNDWRNARNWTEHPEKIAEKTKEGVVIDTGTIIGTDTKYFSVYGEKFDLINRTPILIQEIKAIYKTLEK